MKNLALVTLGSSPASGVAVQLKTNDIRKSNNNLFVTKDLIRRKQPFSTEIAMLNTRGHYQQAILK